MKPTDIYEMLDTLSLPVAAQRFAELSESPEFGSYTALQFIREVLEPQYIETLNKLNILAKQYRDSGIMSTDVPDEDTGIDRLDCFPQNSHQCQAQSRFAVHSRLDIVVDSEIIDAANQAFYCGTL